MMADNYLTSWQSGVNDQFDFAKNAYSEAIPDMAYSIGAAKEIGGLQGRAALDQQLLSRGLAERRGKFNGMEDQYASEAMGWNSAARKEQVAGQALSDVNQAFGNAQAQTGRQMARMGVNPNSGKFAATSGALGMELAKAQAQGMNKARQDLDATADAKQKTAISMGANLNTQSTQAAQVAGYAGNAALASSSQPLKDRLNFAGGVSNIYQNNINNTKDLWGTSNLTAAQKASLDANQAQINATNEARSDANMWGALGSIAGSQTGQNLISSGISWLTS